MGGQHEAVTGTDAELLYTVGAISWLSRCERRLRACVLWNVSDSSSVLPTIPFISIIYLVLYMSS